MTLRGGPVALRMDEDEDAERLCFGPERVERRVRDFHAGDVAADADTAEPKLSNRMLDLIGSEIRKLQRRCREGDRSGLPARSVHELHAQRHGGCHVKIRPVLRTLELVPHQRQRLRHGAMGVNVDCLDAPAVHATPRRRPSGRLPTSADIPQSTKARPEPPPAVPLVIEASWRLPVSGEYPPDPRNEQSEALKRN